MNKKKGLKLFVLCGVLLTLTALCAVQGHAANPEGDKIRADRQFRGPAVSLKDASGDVQKEKGGNIGGVDDIKSAFRAILGGGKGKEGGAAPAPDAAGKGAPAPAAEGPQGDPVKEADAADKGKAVIFQQGPNNVANIGGIGNVMAVQQGQVNSEQAPVDRVVINIPFPNGQGLSMRFEIDPNSTAKFSDLVTALGNKAHPNLKMQTSVKTMEGSVRSYIPHASEGAVVNILLRKGVIVPQTAVGTVTIKLQEPGGKAKDARTLILNPILENRQPLRPR